METILSVLLISLVQPASWQVFSDPHRSTVPQPLCPFLSMGFFLRLGALHRKKLPRTDAAAGRFFPPRGSSYPNRRLVFLMALPFAVLLSVTLMTIPLFALPRPQNAQSYLTPMTFVVIIPAVAAMLPGVELTPNTFSHPHPKGIFSAKNSCRHLPLLEFHAIIFNIPSLRLDGGPAPPFSHRPAKVPSANPSSSAPDFPRPVSPSCHYRGGDSPPCSSHCVGGH